MPNKIESRRCGRCAYLGTFGCEHLCPVRDYLELQYLDEGRLYLEARSKQQQQQPQNSAIPSNDIVIIFSEGNKYNELKSKQCSRCQQLNVFGCEHSTFIRDSINLTQRSFVSIRSSTNNNFENKSKSKKFPALLEKEETIISNHLVDLTSNKVSDIKQESPVKQMPSKNNTVSSTIPNPNSQITPSQEDKKKGGGGCCCLIM